MRIFYTGATIAVALASFSPANAEVIGTCKTHYQRYLSGATPKAFASTGTLAQVKTINAVDCGVVMQWSSKAQAINKALELCNNARKASRRAAQCRIINSKDRDPAFSRCPQSHRSCEK